MFIVLLLGLIAAGIYTHAVVWFVLAGALGALWFLTVVAALSGVNSARKKMKEIDKNFDNLRVRNNKYYRR